MWRSLAVSFLDFFSRPGVILRSHRRCDDAAEENRTWRDEGAGSREVERAGLPVQAWLGDAQSSGTAATTLVPVNKKLVFV
jgi:hypothetical protein